jgi:hypothetical protein
MRYVVRLEQVDEIGMRTVDDKVKAQRFYEDLLRVEDLVRDFVDFLEKQNK